MGGYILILLTFILSSVQAGMVTGTYTGDGASTKAITGLGSTHDVVLVKGATTTAWVATSTMTAGEAKLLTDIDYGPKTGLISSLDSDGFTVAKSGGVSNESGVTYYFVAWEADANLDVGSFTPGSTGAINVSVGYQPAMVWLFGGAENWDEKSPAQYLMDGHDNAATFQFNNGGELTTATYEILDFIDADGFDTRAATNSGTHNGPGVGIEYHYVTLKSSSSQEVGTYLGNNGTAKDVSTSFAADFVMVKNTAGGDNSWFKTTDMAATESFKFTDAATTNNITAISSSPSQFSVGTSGEVNGSNSYDFFASSGLATLPVELIHFVGEKLEFGNALSWKTGAEVNSSHFIIERSNDGRNFESIGMVDAVGFSDQVVDYGFVDQNPVEGNNYYRLVQIDLDGTTYVKKMIVINSLDGSKIARFDAYPNPASEEINLQSNDFERTDLIRISNDKGQIVKEINMINEIGNIQTVPLADFAKGIYFVQFIGEQKILNTTRFVKVK